MKLLNDLTLPAIVTNIIAFLVVTAVHGFALALAARLLGDRTPAYNGRLTLNPFAHLSTPALAMATLFRLGWIRPMRIAIENLRFGRWGLVLCVLFSLAVTLALVPLLWPVRMLLVVLLPRTTGLAVLSGLDAIQTMAVWFSVFNLIPLPPLTGGLLLVAIRPALAKTFTRSAGLIEAIMVALVVVGLAGAVVTPAVNFMQSALAQLR